jgi:hypothetical protein
MSNLKSQESQNDSNLTEEQRTNAWAGLFSLAPLVATFVTTMDAPVRQFAGMAAEACGREPAGANENPPLEVSLDCFICRRRHRTIIMKGLGGAGVCTPTGHQFPGILVEVITGRGEGLFAFTYEFESFADQKYPDEARYAQWEKGAPSWNGASQQNLPFPCEATSPCVRSNSTLRRGQRLLEIHILLNLRQEPAVNSATLADSFDGEPGAGSVQKEVAFVAGSHLMLDGSGRGLRPVQFRQKS